MATGDLRNNLLKVDGDLRRLRYGGSLDLYAASKGDPVALLPLIHFVLLDYSPELSLYLTTKGFCDLSTKRDIRFMEAVYKMLRDEFDYRPQITRDQFFSTGFAERKLIFISDLIRMVEQKTRDLKRDGGGRNLTGTTGRSGGAHGVKGHTTNAASRQPRGTGPASKATITTHSSSSQGSRPVLVPSNRILVKNVSVIPDQRSPNYENGFRSSRGSTTSKESSFHPRTSGAGVGRATFTRHPHSSDSPPQASHSDNSFGSENGYERHEVSGSSESSDLLRGMDIVQQRQAQAHVDQSTISTTNETRTHVERHYAPPQTNSSTSHQAQQHLRPHTSSKPSGPSRPTQNRFPMRPGEGTTIYEPAIAPQPAAPPPTLPPQNFDISFQSQPSMMRTTPIPKAGMLDDTFISEPSMQEDGRGARGGLGGNGPTAGQLLNGDRSWEQKVENQEEGQRQATNCGPLNDVQQHDTRREPGSSHPAPDDVHDTAPAPRKSSSLTSPFLLRSWVAPTAPPANTVPLPSPTHANPYAQQQQNPHSQLQALPSQSNSSPNASIPLRTLPNDQVSVEAVFEHFMNMFAVKHEEIMSLRHQIAAVADQQEGIASELVSRIQSVENTLRTIQETGSRAVNGSRAPPGTWNGATPSDDRDIPASQNPESRHPNGRADHYSATAACQSTDGRTSQTMRSANEVSCRSSELQRYAWSSQPGNIGSHMYILQTAHPAHEVAPVDPDKSFRATISTSQPSMINPTFRGTAQVGTSAPFTTFAFIWVQRSIKYL
ncbi:Centrosomal spindle body, CEP44-domain-containing protein [Fimicolochytrium jonesii]|uniref:Centrosomal spindle body, CEP44-domain-containing protein n=1 Tax=Fimicolochytrium jonesii TaxID=1396493 RepID=UPI0022FEDEDA|nr:Centrosomal spindle body, CEP44-domain-containing protein [Fimicolochytrium jonesii]KAI8815789.1 Centrosomal spindle body, CEP44-domain-containing protein [Fimicolochytrium jonesii]